MSGNKTRKALRRRSSWWRRLLADERGTATSETVIMIPMYVIVWGSIVYVTNFFQNTIEMRMRLRRDVWAYAYTGCNDAPGTATNLPPPSRGILPDSTGGAFESSGRGGASVGESGGVGGLLGALDNLISFVPGMTFSSLTGDRSTGLNRPEVIGGGRMTMRADLTVLCNERPADVFSTIIRLVRSAFGF